MPKRARTGTQQQRYETRREEDLRWAALLRQLQETRDERVLTQLHDQTCEFVFAVTFHYTRDRMLAEDARQKVFIRFANRYTGIRDPMALRGWLGKTATRFAWQLARPRKPKLVLLDDSHWEKIYSQQDAAPTPLELFIQKENGLAIEKAINKALSNLPRRYRDCLYLRYIEQFDPAQVARAMVVSLGSVYEYTARAIVLLADDRGLEELYDEMSK